MRRDQTAITNDQAHRRVAAIMLAHAPRGTRADHLRNLAEAADATNGEERQYYGGSLYLEVERAWGCGVTLDVTCEGGIESESDGSVWRTTTLKVSVSTSGTNRDLAATAVLVATLQEVAAVGALVEATIGRETIAERRRGPYTGPERLGLALAFCRDAFPIPPSAAASKRKGAHKAVRS